MKILERIQMLAIEIAAVPILIWAVWNFQYPDWQIVVLGLLALASIPVLYPLGLLFMGLPFLMTVSILYGVSGCVLATVPYALLGAAFLKNCSVDRKCLIFAFLVCNALLYSLAYQLVNPDRASMLGNVVLGVVAIIVVAFAFSFLAREKERRKENVHLAYSFILAGVCAAFAAALSSFNPLMPVAVLPFMGIVWMINIHLRELIQLRQLLEKYEIPKPEPPQL